MFDVWLCVCRRTTPCSVTTSGLRPAALETSVTLESSTAWLNHWWVTAPPVVTYTVEESVVNSVVIICSKSRWRGRNVPAVRSRSTPCAWSSWRRWSLQRLWIHSFTQTHCVFSPHLLSSVFRLISGANRRLGNQDLELCERSVSFKLVSCYFVIMFINCNYPQVDRADSVWKVQKTNSGFRIMSHCGRVVVFQSNVVRHHWVHRRRQTGKCRQCGKVSLHRPLRAFWFKGSEPASWRSLLSPTGIPTEVFISQQRDCCHQLLVVQTGGESHRRLKLPAGHIHCEPVCLFLFFYMYC